MKPRHLVLIVLAAVLAYLLLWPSPLTPKSWTPPVAPGLEGIYAQNDMLKGIEKLLPGFGVGPEAVAVDSTGNLYTGYVDGRVVQIAADGTTAKELVNTGGRPLGIAIGPGGALLIADAIKGLLRYDGRLDVLSDRIGDQPYGFIDDVDYRDGDRGVYFTDASSKFGFGRHMEDILEHGGNGKLLYHDLETGKTQVLMSGLQFANGVAVGPNGDYVLVNVTGEYRVLRYWLKGEKRGTYDVFIDNLPGFPDNITFNGSDRFWVALFAPRDAMLDQLLPGGPFLRKVVARLPAFVQPKPALRSFALALDLQGKVVANLQYAGEGAYAPITSVRERGDFLYFGSLQYPAVGKLPLKSAIATVP